jgi:hypothetical protein
MSLTDKCFNHAKTSPRECCKRHSLDRHVYRRIIILIELLKELTATLNIWLSAQVPLLSFPSIHSLEFLFAYFNFLQIHSFFQICRLWVRRGVGQVRLPRLLQKVVSGLAELQLWTCSFALQC